VQGGVGGLVELVQRIWATALERREVGPDDDFFDLGGDSIAGMRVAADVASALGLSTEEAEDLYLEIFERSTARAFAEGIEAVTGGRELAAVLDSADAA
jgi:Phosphopantetheine attachment site